jgi:integrase
MPNTDHVPAYKLHKASGQARVIIGGKHHYLGPYGSQASRERYGRLVAEFAAGGGVIVAQPAGEPFLTVQLAAAYWQFAEGYYQKDGKPSPHLAAVRVALGLLRRLYGNTSAVEFGPLALRAIQGHLVEAGNTRGYVNSICGIIKRVFRWAASQELVPVTAYQALATLPGLKRGRTAAREPAPIGPVADAVVEATLAHLPPVIADMVRLQRLTGCRPGEVCDLRPCDVDRSGEVWAYRPAGHKTAHLGRERIVWIGPQAQDVILPYLLRADTAYCFSPAESEEKRLAEMRTNRKSPVQPSQVDRRKRRPKRSPAIRYIRHVYTRAVQRAVELANRGREVDDLLPAWSPNQLRHTAATRIRREFGLEAAQVCLGHAKADVTQVYAERDGKLAAEVMRRIG